MLASKTKANKKGYAADSKLVWDNNQFLSCNKILQDASILADYFESQYPGAPVVNLCDRRKNFMVSFAASLLSSRCTLLPPAPDQNKIDEIKQKWGSLLEVDDNLVDSLHETQSCSSVYPATMLTPDTDFTAVTLFTSGSTGRSKPHSRTFKQLRRGTQALKHIPYLNSSSQLHIISTVPPQHLFGLESSIMLPLFGNHCVISDRPLYPLDIQDYIEKMPHPRVLTTTPIHLHACISSDQIWPEVDLIISSTSPLDPDLARRAESRFNSRVLEIYGSTETGALAYRFTTEEKLWTPLPGVTISSEHKEFDHIAHGPHFPECPVNDRIRLECDGRFELLGRNEDLVKIAGKRHSLAALSYILQKAPGVNDAVMLQPTDEGVNSRLTALIVTDGATAESIRKWLYQQVDPVFIPRPMIFVEHLPRNANGKIPQESIEELLNRTRN
ncbi:AMP-binding protein [Halorhodospira halochloris]|uniref:AMP-binding protein n=1 Tax=Halorhodospira halochloris TaxID=1052 RepID=UPI001EE7D3D1|nr:AMP-binding protein [Halorhodospira halochloris]MCG5529924.1 AMP-binding protein [Halorhodospira halochloris]